ncbi:LacI family DNA-binding transcriptional regulator [Acholeplasma equirhinis]|uniref:LacI family DNA-binding transcriptional regulator n=1 Tax=Acholeplasma equirhinis TaxID=555393 RepID=UPI00197A8C44|nr:LacI family DNA-binding transcriptional regulator [Acholeplasma equirhinis]MBN3490407.1 LacI family DNA-binding transcriptional regulator [Acholeplasma equirhinis]
MKKQNIYTLAKELDVSPGTISKVLNNTGKVSEATRTRILEYIEKVGYVPTMSARMLKSKSSKTIGVIFSEELNIGLEHPFFSSVLQHFKTYVENEGYELSFIVTKLGKNRLSYLKWCMNKKVDGVYIVVGNYNDKGIEELIGSEIPVVSTDMVLKGLKAVVSDNDHAVKSILEYSVQKLNKKKIGMVVGPQQSKAFEQRFNAYKKYMNAFNLPINEKHIVYAQGFGFTSGYQATLNLLGNEDLPEVLFVSSDEISLGVLKAFQDHKIDVPNQIQVIGFDDIPVARYVTPSLTTMMQDRKILGETAAKTLLSMIENPDTEVPDVTLIDTKLIKRESTKEA